MRWGLLIVLLACSNAPVAEFRVVSGDDDPLAGATELVLALEQGDTTLVEQRFDVALTSLRLRELPFGEGYRLRLDAFAGRFLVARGRSLLFDVGSSGPSRRPDIWLAPIGVFTDEVTPPLDSPPSGLTDNVDGALVVSEAGTVYRYVHHRESDARPELERLINHPELANARLGVQGSRFVAIGGGSEDARIVRADGSLGPRLRIDGQRYGAVVATDGDTIVVLGGSDRELGAASTIARVLQERGDDLVLEREDPLPCAVRDSRAAVIPVTSPAGSVRVVTVCSGGLRTSELVAYDPASGSSSQLELPGDLQQAGLASLGPGLLLVTGGRDPEGALTDVSRVVGVGGERLQELMPGPEPLFRPREGHASLPLGPGLVLIVGGTDDAGAVATSELVAFPGDVVLTDSMGSALARPMATSLRDGVVLVVGQGGVSLWVVPR